MTECMTEFPQNTHKHMHKTDLVSHLTVSNKTMNLSSKNKGLVVLGFFVCLFLQQGPSKHLKIVIVNSCFSLLLFSQNITYFSLKSINFYNFLIKRWHTAVSESAKIQESTGQRAYVYFLLLPPQVYRVSLDHIVLILCTAFCLWFLRRRKPLSN